MPDIKAIYNGYISLYKSWCIGQSGTHAKIGIFHGRIEGIIPGTQTGMGIYIRAWLKG